MKQKSLIKAALFQPDLMNKPTAWLGHIPFAAAIIFEKKPRVVVELGSHWGHSYFAFCKAVENAGYNTQCFAVDTWQGDPHAGEYAEEVYTSFIENNKKYSQFSKPMRMRFEDAVSKFKDGTIDLLHIDGLHTYEAVKNDFETWLPKMAPAGIILMHDTCAKFEGFGVWRYWSEIRVRHPQTLEFVHSNGLGVVNISTFQGGGEKWLNSELSIQNDLKTYFENLGNNLASIIYNKKGKNQAILKNINIYISYLKKRIINRLYRIFK